VCSCVRCDPAQAAAPQHRTSDNRPELMSLIGLLVVGSSPAAKLLRIVGRRTPRPSGAPSGLPRLNLCPVAPPGGLRGVDTGRTLRAIRQFIQHGQDLPPVAFDEVHARRAAQPELRPFAVRLPMPTVDEVIDEHELLAWSLPPWPLGHKDREEISRSPGAELLGVVGHIVRLPACLPPTLWTAQFLPRVAVPSLDDRVAVRT